MIYHGLGILAVSFILTACGGSSSSSSSGSTAGQGDVQKEVFTPSEQAIQSIKIVDALNKPLKNAEVVFTPLVESSSKISPLSFSMAAASSELVVGDCSTGIATNASTGETDDEGGLTIDDLSPGTYSVKICKGGIIVTIELTILPANAAPAAIIAAPVTVDEDDVVTKLTEGTIIVAVSGVIYSDSGVVANAQVSISGGALTNGAIATAITDASGFYSIIINMNGSKLAALQDASIQISAEGFEDINITEKDFTQFGAFSGVNIQLTPVNDDTVDLVYEENFEVLYTDKTCGNWTSEALDIVWEDGEMNMMVASETIENSLPENLWHTHKSGLNIKNQAYIAELVSLAPNDLSEGNVPDPAEGMKACWYGRGDADGAVEEGNFLNEYGSVEEGNFLNENSSGEVAKAVSEEECTECGYENEMNGGTSVRAHSGALISPRIDLSSEDTPLALTFKTWWEIEAVNPNESGFDLMSIEYKIEGTGEGEGEWVTLARLNPLTDPEGNNLESLPYSNLGFNQAPNWLQQAPISLDSLAGKAFQLRFNFSTVDQLYNGFRGWLLDDVQISHKVGTFPLWDEIDHNSIDENLGDSMSN